MVEEYLNIYEYEEALLGQRQKEIFKVSFQGSASDNKREFGVIWRYAVTNILRWTPQEAAACLTDEIVRRLLLDRTFIYIDYNPKIQYMPDYRFALQYAFPGIISYDLKTQALEDYSRVAKIGKYAYDKKEVRYPKNFFLDEDGIARASYILDYLIRTEMGDLGTEKIYDFFANTELAKMWLKEHKLNVPLRNIFEDPMDYLHYTLGKYTRRADNCYYFSYQIEKAAKKMIVKIKEEENRENEE